MKNSAPSIDWKSLFVKLTATATKWFVDENVDKEDPMINGVAPKDLAQTAVLELIKTYHQIKHSKTEDDFYRLAYKIIRHDFLDLIKSSAYRKNKRIEEINEEKPGQEISPVEDGNFLKIENKGAAKDYYSLAKGEHGLIEFIDAVLELDVYNREDVADLLGVTPQEVTKRQQKLRDRYTSREKKAAKLVRLKLK
jgi:DNA-directed RNA polymerase specialized sigma24 family protein